MNKVIFLTIVAIFALLAFCEGRVPPGFESRAPVRGFESRAPIRVEDSDPSPVEACLSNGSACQADGSWGNCCSGFCYQWAGYSHGFCQ